MTTFTDLLEQHAAESLERQLALGELIGEADWQASLSDGTITFGGRHTFPIQLMGSESEGAGTWLWSWANTQSNLPGHVLKAASRLREYGEREGIPELSEAELDLADIDGHTLCMVARGLAGADAYYRGPYQGGAAFMLIEAPQLREQKTSPVRVVNVFTQLIQIYELDHRRALEAYLRQKGYAVQTSADGLEGRAPTGAAITATFDGHGRLTNLSTSAGPEDM